MKISSMFMETPAIDWESEESVCLLNPRLPEHVSSKIHSALSQVDLPGHFWIATSGTSAMPKLAALSKEAILISGKAVNSHLGINRKDTWLNILPLFHVGGIGIHARSYVSGAKVFDYSKEKWDPQVYWRLIKEHKASWSSLVPAQVFDLVQLDLAPPETLRGVIIGGGAMNEKLQSKAFELGWPLYRSYGMTECCSGIATATEVIPGAPLVPLGHIHLRINDQGLIEISSKSLLTTYLYYDQDKPELIDPKIEGWYRSEDRGLLREGCLEVLGRGEQFLKIGGESIDFSLLEKTWDEIKVEFRYPFDAVLIDMPHERLGATVHLAVAATGQQLKLDLLVVEFNQRVLPIAKIRKIHDIAAVPRSALKKLLKTNLRKLLEGGAVKNLAVPPGLRI